jgi:uncharacterized phiE125 gp8 family phage protein
MTVSLVLITPPTEEPVTLAEARLQCKADGTEEDALLTLYIASARRTAEHLTGRVFCTQTWEARMDAFPPAEIELPKPTVQSIVSLKYTDADGLEQTIDPGNYALDAAQLPGWALPAVGFAWPATQGIANAVRVRFVAGYGNAAAVPHNIKQWMLLQIAAAFRNREAFASGISANELPNRWVDGLLDSERTYL